MERKNQKIIKNQTSFYEQAIFYYLKRYFPDAVNRCILGDDFEADIYLHNLKCVIEYDGAYWHANRKERDEIKNRFFNSIGLYVIRVRDVGLPELEEFNGIIFFHKKQSSDKTAFHIDEIIELIIHHLAILSNDEKEKELLSSFTLPHDRFLFDSPDINAVLYTEPVSNSLAECYGIDKWDYEKNGRLDPHNITWRYNQRIFFKCRNGKSIFAHHTFWLWQTEEQKEDFYRICPYLPYCEENCEIMKDYLLSYLDGRMQIEEDSYQLIRYMLGNSVCTKYCLEKRFENDCSELTKENFERLFILNNHAIPSFLGRRMTWLSTMDDLALIKKLHSEYLGIIIWFDAIPFDKSDYQRKAFISYFQWLIWLSEHDKNHLYLINKHLFNCIRDGMVEKKLTTEFAKLLIEFINEYSSFFRTDDFEVRSLQSYIE